MKNIKKRELQDKIVPQKEPKGNPSNDLENLMYLLSKEGVYSLTNIPTYLQPIIKK